MSTLLTESDSAWVKDAALRMMQEEEQLTLVSKFNLVPFKDGNQWCVLLGANPQEGISGFGNTPMSAIHDFNQAMYNSQIKPSNQSIVNK